MYNAAKLTHGISETRTSQFLFAGPGARKGDSGGGLVFYDDKERRYFLRGIVSSGKSDTWNKPTSVAAFTDISHYLTWLDTERKTVEREQARANKGSPT